MTRTMAELRAEIEVRRIAFAEEPFLRGLDSSSDAEDVRRFVPHLYFFVYVFQDILRLSHEHMTQPELRDIARRLRDEDAGHDDWFAFDVEALDCTRDVSWVMGREHRVTRDSCYAIVSELLSVRDDRARFVVPLVLEAAGSVFFVRVIDLLDRAGYRGQLRYFARHHQEVEAEHDIFSSATGAALDAITFDPESFAQAQRLMHRVFDHLVRLAAHLEGHRTTMGTAGLR